MDIPDEEITSLNIKAKTFEKIIEYLKHYQTEKPKDIPRPLPGSDISPPVLDQWDYDYISKLSFQECVDLINDAIYLDIRELVNLVSARLASDMINDEVETIKEKLKGIKSTYTVSKIISFK